MGAKINFKFLTNKNNTELIKIILNLLHNNEWEYNKHIIGEYTYWINGPIWQLGDSKTIRENSVRNYNDKEYEIIINEIINNITNHYSPSITLSNNIFSKIILLNLSISENNDIWNEVVISFDRYDIYDSLDNESKNQSKMILEKIFNSLSIEIEPYYGIGATEIESLVNKPEDLNIKKLQLGDFNYFSKGLINKENVIEYENKYKINFNNSGSCFIQEKNNLLSIG